jgi:hypothetical protein
MLMKPYLLLFLILLNSLFGANLVRAQESVPANPRSSLKLCQNWSGFSVLPEDIPDGEMDFEDRGEQSIWGFYGLVTATCTISWMRSSFDLVEITFWDLGRVVSLWVALGTVLWNQEYLPTGPGDYDQEIAFRVYQPGTHVYVYLQGPHVFVDHIDWAFCDTTFCWIAEQIDQQAWVGSNELIEGSYPSKNYPLYGFLFWHVMLALPPTSRPADTILTHHKDFFHEAY